MSTLDMNKTFYKKTTWIYGGVTAFCLVFSRIYTYFGHGVTSPYMTYLYIYPLLLGVVPFLALSWFGTFHQEDARMVWGLRLYNYGVAAWNTGSLLSGIFEIAGTGSDYLSVYVFGGGVLLLSGLILFVPRVLHYRKG